MDEKRQFPRISWNFLVKFKAVASESERWEVSTIQDLSKGGCGFFTGIKYTVGEILDIQIQFPALRDPVHFQGEVKRCEEKGSTFLIGVRFINMDETKTQEFNQMLDFFLKKQSGG